MYEPPSRTRNFGPPSGRATPARAGATRPALVATLLSGSGSEAPGAGVEAADVRNAQIRSRSDLAPFLAFANVGAGVAVAGALWDVVSPLQLGAWLLAVVAANLIAARNAISQGLVATSRVDRSGTDLPIVADAAGRALLWVSLPLYVFPGLPAHDQLLIASVMAGLVTGGIAFVTIPRAAMAWVGAFTLALCAAMFLGRAGLDFDAALGVAAVGAVGISGVTRLAAWSISQIQTVAAVDGKSEQAQQLLKEYEQRGAGWLWQTDAENRTVYISSRMAQMLGKSTNQLIGHSLPASLGGAANLGRALIAREPFATLEMEVHTDRGVRWVSVSGDPFIGSGGAFEGFRGVGSDITDVRQTQARLQHLANVDVLSGLPNRGRVRQLLGENLAVAIKSQIPCAILFLDLDGFKPVNDTYGHAKGDGVLKTVAQRLLKEVGVMGHVGRMGGDEFAVVITDAQSRVAVENLAARILESIAQPCHFDDKLEVRVGVSIGCAFGPIDGSTVDDLILKADLALYEAKGQGRGRCCYFSAALQNEAEDRVRLEQELRTALDQNQFRLMYQPLIDAQSQKLVGFEALLRWHHPERGVVPPNIFVPIAEDSNLIVPIGEWVIHEACRAAASWPEHITVALNLSPRQLIMPALPNSVSEALARYRLPGNRIELEVTESVFLDDSDGSLDVLKRLRSLGVGIALDDFGTGYSSLGYLNKAVFHKLKIDGSFVREAAARPGTVAVIKSIVQLASNFRLHVTAEGVETVEDFERMRDLGVNTMQGYLFGRPMAYDRANELVHGQNKRKAG